MSEDDFNTDNNFRLLCLLTQSPFHFFRVATAGYPNTLSYSYYTHMEAGNRCFFNKLKMIPDKNHEYMFFEVDYTIYIQSKQLEIWHK